MYQYQLTVNNEQMKIYRFPYEPVDSNMFFIPIGDTGIVFDPNENDELLHVFEQHSTKSIIIVLTHEHYDHTNGVEWLQSKIESKLFCHQDCAKTIATERGNDPKLVAFIQFVKDSEDGGHRYNDFKHSLKKYSLHADITFKDRYNLAVGNIELKCYSMPGHSPGSAVYILGDNYVFTGDSLIQNKPTILRFPGSDKKLYHEVTKTFLKSLDMNSIVFPGHGDPFIICEAAYLYNV